MAFKTAFYILRFRSADGYISSKFSSIGFNNVSKSLGNDQKSSMKFNDASLVFGHKTTKELLRGFFVLHACSFDSLVNRSHDLMQTFERVFGSRLLRIAVAPFYNQFVAGNTEENISKVNETLASTGINLMIAPMLETDMGDLFRISSKYESLNDVGKRNAVLEWSLAMEKLGTEEDSTKIENGKGLGVTDQDLAEIMDALYRLYKIGKLCVTKDVILAVDAEYSYLNHAISLITLAMKAIFNKEKPVIWNTYQGYLKDSKYWLQHDLQLTRSFGVKFGAKIVRGAYMENERARAVTNKTPSPIHDSYEETNESYSSLVDFIMPVVAAEPSGCHVIIATHNENSIIHSTRLIKNLGIAREEPSLVFGQIYGMAENISVTLAKHGYHVYKSVPFGSVTETLPYLARRANENRVVFQGARQEKKLLATELRNRLLLRNSNN